MTTPETAVGAGREAARELWMRGLAASTSVDPFTRQFAEEALDELETLQQGTAGVLREVLEGAQMSAEQLNVESFHGLIEVVQNADDLHATEVRVAFRKSSKQEQLLIAHDGDRVQLGHVIAMTLAFVSTKRDDPSSKGRFGIGLKTLGRLGSQLTVHCEPYHFSISGNSVRRADPVQSIEGYFDADSTNTLLVLDLREGFDPDEFVEWFQQLGAEALLFLDTVRSLRLVDLVAARTRVEHGLNQEGRRIEELAGIEHECWSSTMREPASGRSWRRYEVAWPVSGDVKRRHKAVGETMPVAVALEVNPDESALTQLYAGLPIASAAGLPFSANAQFDIDVARRGIQHEPLNHWCFQRIAELAAGVALARLRAAPATSWQAIPLLSDITEIEDRWIREQIVALVEAVQSSVRNDFALRIDGSAKALDEIAYEGEPIDGLLTQHEVDGLTPGRLLLPRGARDRRDRWRGVLHALGGAQRIDVKESLELLDWPDEDLGPHDVKWFIKLVAVGIQKDLGQQLWSQRCVLTADGARIVPPWPHVEGELLLRSANRESLATRLGLAHVIDPAYLSTGNAATVVREWLESEDSLRNVPDAEGTLRALAARHSEDPLTASDDELRAIRDAFVSLASDVQLDVGPDVGQAIAIDVQRWVAGKRVVGKACPADAYLPASIEDRKDGWSKAAGTTSGIAWVHTRYEDVLRRAGHRARRGAPKPLAAKSFFALLGAEVAPRLLEHDEQETRFSDPASPIDYSTVPEIQREELSGLARYSTHFKADRVSPDLAAVLRSISKERARRTRYERARALLSTLEREWERLYASHVEAVAVYSSNTWYPAGRVPATWLAVAIDEPWLSSEDGARRSPRELAVRTRATEAIYGNDRSRFAYELDETEANVPLVRALRIETDPQVSEMVEQIESMRSAASLPDERMLTLRYAAVAAACKKRDLMPDDMVGDLSVRQLRARFGHRVTGTGLVFAAGQWLPPARVFLGAAIFGQRGPFVSERTGAEPLWRVLRVDRPTVSDCLDVLDEIARSSLLTEADEQIVLNTYVYLAERLNDATKRERERLRRLPLWTGSVWTTARPVYAIRDSELARALGTQLPVWQLPVAPSAIPQLMAATEVTLLDGSSFDPVVREHAFPQGTPIQTQFAASVELLRDWLSRHDTRLVATLSLPWEELAGARIALDPALQLELRLGRRQGVRVPARAHVTRGPLTFYATDPDTLGEDDAGGQAVASLFSEGDHDKVALAWNRSWAHAARGERGAVSLIEDTSGESLDDLFNQAKGQPVPDSRKRRKSPPKGRGSGRAVAAPLPARQLKTLDDFKSKSVAMTDGGRVVPGAAKGRGLKPNPVGGRPVGGGGGRAPTSAPLAYSEEEKEALALELLQIAINGEQTELRDYRHLRGVGADALDKLKRYFEIKAHYGDLPEDVTLTANEAERAYREGGKFFLAVIGGLEEGYNTVIRIFSDPLRNLALKPTTSVTLTGIRQGGKAITVRLDANEPEKGDAA